MNSYPWMAARQPSKAYRFVPSSPARWHLRVDRGQSCENVGRGETEQRLAAISRSASVSIAERTQTFWLVLRGSIQIECQEGVFRLKAGEWIALDRDSRPSVQTDRSALVLSLLLPSPDGGESLAGVQIFPGTGAASLSNKTLALRLWRAAGVFNFTERELGSLISPALSKSLGNLISDLQADIGCLLHRCPGKSLRRRRQILARMQKAKLYLAGNFNRNVRLQELAKLTVFSTWHFAKTFLAVYGEGPREVLSDIRLQQAQKLLASTDLSVGEVGEACGFVNACSFARAFKAKFAITASSYRGEHKWT